MTGEQQPFVTAEANVSSNQVVPNLLAEGHVAKIRTCLSGSPTCRAHTGRQ
jgi:hypothetical protein